MLTNNLYFYFCVVLVYICFPTAVKSYEIISDFQSHPTWKLLDRGEECGYSSSDRIIGGVRARLGQYPWIARLGYNLDDDPDSLDRKIIFDCGGAIISDRYVLTAAHCGPDIMGLSLVKVRLGEYKASSDIDCQDGVCAPPVQDIDVEESICHRKYNNANFQHDICLLRLATQIKFNKYVFPLCLPSYDYFHLKNHSGTIMEVAGWGITNITTGETSDVLLTLKVPVIDQNACVTKYTSIVQIKDTQMCAGGVVGKDSCSGDSGGPLMSAISLDAPPRYFVVGIVSFGMKLCANSNSPGIYTNVFQYMKWILDNVRK